MLQEDEEDEKILQALSEVYSSDPEEFRRIYQRGRYDFYPDKTLTDLASELSGTEKYKFDTVEEVLNDLFRRGFEETSTGVIQLLES